MAIHKDGGEYVCKCQNCGEEYYGGVCDDFRAFVEEVKANGWRIYKDGDGWAHLCPCCAEGT